MSTITYFELLNRAVRLYHEGRLAEAYDLVTQNGELVEGNPAQIFNFRCSIASRLGERALALRLMHEAVIDLGYWYGHDYLMADEDLESLRSSPEFQSLAATCKEREIEAKRNGKPTLKLMRQVGHDADERKLLRLCTAMGTAQPLSSAIGSPA